MRQSASVELHLIGAEQLSAQRRLLIDTIGVGLLGEQAIAERLPFGDMIAGRISESSYAYDNR